MKKTKADHQQTILIADPHKDSRLVYQTFLESLGFAVTAVEDGLSLLKHIYNTRPDMVIMDSHLSRINGYESCRIIKRDEKLNSIPVILLNSSSRSEVASSIDVDADYYLRKDLNLSALSSVIADLTACNGRHPSDQAPQERQMSDSEILVHINGILDRRLLESTLVNKILECTNTLGNYQDAVRKVFSKLNSVFKYSMVGIYLAEEQTVFIDRIDEVDEEYVNWVLYKVQGECRFESTEIERVFVFNNKESEKGAMWDVDGQVIVHKLKTDEQYLGSFIIARLEPNGFTDAQSELVREIMKPLVTILDNTRMYRHIERANIELQEVHSQLIESCKKLDNKVEDRTLLLRKLHEATRLVTTIHEPNRLLATIVDVIINSIGTEVGLVILLDQGRVSKKIEFGLNLNFVKNLRFKNKEKTSLIKRIIRKGEIILMNEDDIVRKMDLGFLKSRNLRITSLAAVPFKSGHQITGFVVIINKLNGEDFTKEDIVTLTTLSSMASVAIENATLYKQTIRKTKLETDIMMAMEIQTELLPKQAIKNDYLEVDSRYLPAECVGGDYYDYINIDQDNTGFVVADVTGHGVSAAFIMTLVKSCMQLTAQGVVSTRKVMSALNTFMCKNVPNNNLVSMLYAIVNTEKRTLTYTSAGHNPSIWFRKESGTFESLTTDGLFLCMFDTTEYGELEVQFAPGDIFMFYTDGLTEAKNHRNEMFGIERIKEIIAKNADWTAEQISAVIYRELQLFIGKSSLNDDLTYSVLKIKK